jgi:hypothetical protein
MRKIINFSNRSMRRKNAYEARKNKKNIESCNIRVVNPPKILSLNRAPEETRAFLSEVRKLADDTSPNSRRRVDLNGLKEIDLDAALSLVAELDRWQRIKGIYLSPETVSEWDKNIVSKLYSLGFFDLLGTNISGVSVGKVKKHWIPFISSTQTVGYAAKKLRVALTKIMNCLDSSVSVPIYAPLIESMKNAIEHAYSDIGDDIANYHHFGKRWWMAGSYDEDQHCIDIVFLDLGMTIPATLPNSRYWPALQLDSVYGHHLNYDSVRTRAAMLYGMSQTGQYQRGKGFQNIVEPAYHHPKNAVVVISRKAHCFVMYSGTAVSVESNIPFAGTLIQWHINLPELPQNDDAGEKV